MSAAADVSRVDFASVARAVDPYRERLTQHSYKFTLALLVLARANVKSLGSFNHPSPERAAALAALSRWRQDAHRALARVKGVPSDAAGRDLAVKWLEALLSAQSLTRKGLSSTDPLPAAHAARSAQQRLNESHRLQALLDQRIT